MEARGVIFNIQKFSIHDGPGVRTTVFMKGCPLRCKWCSNPESQLSGVQIMYDAGSCVHCLHCTQSCPAKAVTAAQDGRIHIDFHKCTGCLVCVQSCPGRALTVEGEYKTVSEITGIDFSQIETDEEAERICAYLQEAISEIAYALPRHRVPPYPNVLPQSSPVPCPR